MIQTAFAGRTGKATVVNIPDLPVTQCRVFKSSGDRVVPSEIILLYVRVEIIRIIEIPIPIAGHIEGGYQIGMPVFQLV